MEMFTLCDCDNIKSPFTSSDSDASETLLPNGSQSNSPVTVMSQSLGVTIQHQENRFGSDVHHSHWMKMGPDSNASVTSLPKWVAKLHVSDITVAMLCQV